MAVLTAAAAIALLAPLMRNRAGATARDAEIAIYRDQLDEISRDVTRGVLAPGEADAARNEISRRLIKAGDEAPDTAILKSNRPRIAALIAIVVLPLVGLAVYPWWLGSPDQRDMPIEARLNNPQPDDLPALAALLDQTLATTRDDPQLWMMAAQVYMQVNDFDGVASAYENLVRLQGATFDTNGDTGLLLAQGIMQFTGDVTAPVVRIAQALLTVHPDLVEPQIYLAVALTNEGQRDAAVSAWQHILTLAPPEGAPWVAYAQTQLAALGAPVEGGVTAADPIREMVANLAGRLIDNPQDAEGWMRLIRSYVVLGEPAAARDAVTSARSTFAGNAQAITMIENGVIATPAAAVTANAGDANSWVQLIRSYSVLGRTEQATEALGQARTALAGNVDGLALIDAVAQELEQP